MRHAAALAAVLLAACSGGGEPQVTVRDAWARATVAGQTATAAYMTIENKGTADDRLERVSSDAASSATLHETSMTNGVARMRELTGGVELPGGEATKLQPQGIHVMLTGLTRPAGPGETIELQLHFQRSGVQTVPVQIVAGAAGGMEGMEMGH